MLYYMGSKIMPKEIFIIIIEIVLRVAIYYGITVGGHVLLGALYLRCSVFATEDDTWRKCIKKSWINSRRMRPWYCEIED